MPVANSFSITFGGFAVGGSSSYQLLGPYVLDRSYTDLRIVFDIVVTSTTQAGLFALATNVETNFAKRLVVGDTVLISIGGSTWTYTVGTSILKCSASVAKSGNPDTDLPYSRSYTCTIAGDMPALDATDAGLRDVEVHVDLDASRQRVVTMRGVYTGLAAQDAVEVYEANFDSEATTYLTAVDPAVTWELVNESYTLDRERSGGAPHPHLCQFSRQYMELIAPQDGSTLDDPAIRDHRVIFTDLSQYPGDGRESVNRLRRVIGSYDCAVDINESTDLPDIYENTVRPHVIEIFRDEFQPSTFGIEDVRVSFDETRNRISVAIQFLYQSRGGDQGVVEVSQSVAFRENRTIDYTPLHNEDEFAANADVGWATLERIWTRTVIVVGDQSPSKRIQAAPTTGAAGLFNDTIGGERGPDGGGRAAVQGDGWNIVSSTSQVTPQWIGDPEGDGQIRLTTLNETVIERWHRRPSASGNTSGGTTSSPGTSTSQRIAR